MKLGNLILIVGKGGVGKTTVSHAVSSYLADQGRRVLLAHVTASGDDCDKQTITKISPRLWEITLSPHDCFREYISLKLKLKTLSTFFLNNKIIQYLEKAAPGVREIVLLGKVWHERNNYDHVVVDMPSTGHALAMIHTPFNFAKLFPGGPIYQDSLAMSATLENPQTTSFIGVTLAEEMPLQETFELSQSLKALVPRNPLFCVINRLTQTPQSFDMVYDAHHENLPSELQSNPLWQSLQYRVLKKRQQEQQLLKFQLPLSKDQSLRIPEISERNTTDIIQRMMQILKEQFAGGSP